MRKRGKQTAKLTKKGNGQNRLKTAIFICLLCAPTLPQFALGTYIKGGGATSWIAEGDYSSDSVSGGDVALGLLANKNTQGAYFAPFFEVENVSRGYTVEGGAYGEIYFKYLNFNVGENLFVHFGPLLVGLRLGLGFDTLYALEEKNTGYTPEFLMSRFNNSEIGFFTGAQIGYLAAGKYAAGIYADYYKGFGEVYRTIYTGYSNRSVTYGLYLIAYY